MTTLDVHLGQLETAVAPYPVVKDLRVSTQFPHGMRIHVIEQLPVGAIVAGGRDDRGQPPTARCCTTCRPASLPTIPLRSLPGGSRVTDQTALDALALLAAAPQRLRGEDQPGHDDPAARAGRAAAHRAEPSTSATPTELGAKWTAATAVLAAPQLGRRRLHRRDRSGAAGRRRERGGARRRRARHDRLAGAATGAGHVRQPASTREPRPQREEPNPQLEL